MENTLFGSNRTKLTGRTNDFNLDTGLYEAMYEQSQMELKILEAMIKADSLSRKYRAQGIYTEAAIQAFNEEAKTKIGKAIRGLIKLIKDKITTWWGTFKSFVTRVIDKIKAKFSNADVKQTDNRIKSNLHIEVKWPAKNIDWVKMATSMHDFIMTEYSDNNIKSNFASVGAGNNDQLLDKLNSKADKYFAVMADEDSFFTTKKLGDLPELTNGGLKKLIADKEAQVKKMGDIINKAIGCLDDFERKTTDGTVEDTGLRGYMAYISGANKCLFDAMKKMQKIAKDELGCYLYIDGRLNAKALGPHTEQESAILYAEAAMYEAFMAPSTSDYDLYSAEGIKRFAAAKLEAAMGEISDVIDQAIGSNNAQGIENVNLAGTDVLGAGVSNDPNRLVYDDDCYSQGGTFGDENIAGYVDANIAGTSTSVARGNETKAAMEGFLFNW